MSWSATTHRATMIVVKNVTTGIVVSLSQPVITAGVLRELSSSPSVIIRVVPSFLISLSLFIFILILLVIDKDTLEVIVVLIA